MNINNVNLTISAVSAAQYPDNLMYDIAFAGRSNVGKSSLINKLLNRKSLARVSSKPGKTATINFYNVDDKMYLVDLPGYGYAKVSKVEKKKWAVMIEEYFSRREQLQKVVLLVDSRHKPTDDDVLMMNWIRYYKGSVIIAATKWDKVKPKEREGNLELIRTTLQLTNEDTIIPFSSQTGEGRDMLWGALK
jgi:GTP-binding protein